MKVLKASGEQEEFDPGKIRGTCLRAGASEERTKEIVKEITNNVYDGISTREILKRILQLLRKTHPGAASRYDLKRAIMSLGPSGFPFEKFFARILEHYGYETAVGNILRGKCVDHEIDISAKKDKKRYMIECKYHNVPGLYTGLKVALYTYARFLDLKDYFDQPWLVCNTKLSHDAIRYANCQGLKVTCWGYPGEQSLIKLVEDEKLYPVTLFKSLKNYEKGMLMQANLMLVRDFVDQDIKELKKKNHLPLKILTKAVKEAKAIF